MHEILLSFVGNRDPHVAETEEFGPVLSLLQARDFSRVVLFCNGADYIERARSVEVASTELDPSVKFNFVSLELASPIDYEEIYRELKRAMDQYLSTISHLSRQLSILLDPGTPQMQTAWFLLVASGYLDAQLLQGIPARFAGGAYKVREIDLDHDLFPGISIHKSPATAVGASPVEGQGEGSSGTRGGDSPRSPWLQNSATTLVGSSDGVRILKEQAQKVAQYDVSVLIRGETGTGKEVVARMVHESSGRSAQPFVPVNCAAVSPNLAESELFGHAKGAFTGADQARLGKLRAADGGTVFLDEVGDLPADIQPKLLRVLEDQIFTPVGEDKPVKVDVRVIAATNRDMDADMAAGLFRSDLYQRLAQITIELPPLRERTDDIPILLNHFIDLWNQQYGEEKGLSEESYRYLLEYPWPGNIRELQNAVKAICAMGQSSQIGPELLPTNVQTYFNRDQLAGPIATDIPNDGMNLRALLHQVEHDFYARALKLADGNGEAAARLLGVNGAAFRKAAKERFGLT